LISKKGSGSVASGPLWAAFASALRNGKRNRRRQDRRLLRERAVTRDLAPAVFRRLGRGRRGHALILVFATVAAGDWNLEAGGGVHGYVVRKEGIHA
jgi:hypothetical protein